MDNSNLPPHIQEMHKEAARRFGPVPDQRHDLFTDGFLDGYIHRKQESESVRDNSKKLTPEEIMAQHQITDIWHPMYDVVSCMKQYAAQEISEREAEINSLKLNACELAGSWFELLTAYRELAGASYPLTRAQKDLHNRIISQRDAEKDALLKEAIEIIELGMSLHPRGVFYVFAKRFIDETGTEADTHGKDDL